MNYKSKPTSAEIKSRRTRKTDRKARFKNNSQLKRVKPPSATTQVPS